MPITISPTAYIGMLGAIPVSLPDGTATTVALRNYRCELESNGGAAAGMQFMQAVGDAARSQHLPLESNTIEMDPAQASYNAQRARTAATQHRPAPEPLHQTNSLDMRRAATGKATIHQLRSVMTNLAIWLANDGAGRLGNLNLPTKPSYWGMHEGQSYVGPAFLEQLRGPWPIRRKLQLIADTFCGYDCNGFVGTWLHLNGYRRSSESAIPDYFTEAQAISDVGQIVPYMLIRFEGDVHINVIESSGSDRNHWNVCASELGGIARNSYTITPTPARPKRFRVSGSSGMSSAAALIGPITG